MPNLNWRIDLCWGLVGLRRNKPLPKHALTECQILTAELIGLRRNEPLPKLLQKFFPAKPLTDGHVSCSICWRIRRSSRSWPTTDCMTSDPKQPAPVATTMSFKFEAVPRCSNAEARRKWSEAVFTAFCTAADLAFVYWISLAHLGGTSVL